MAQSPWLPVAVLWLHVFGATLWFGAFLTVTCLVRPSLDAGEMEKLAQRFMPRARRLMLPTALVVGLTGVLMGTVFGPIRSSSDLARSWYGMTWIAALVFGLLAFWPRKPPLVRRLHAEGFGFFGAFTTMILLHFGL